jgi:hypothetical protein
MITLGRVGRLDTGINSLNDLIDAGDSLVVVFCGPPFIID